MPTAQIRINKTKDMEDVLRALQAIYRLLNESELVKLALSKMYESEIERKREAWITSLPLMELSDEEQASLTEGIKTLEQERKNGTLKEMTADEVMEVIRNYPDE